MIFVTTGVCGRCSSSLRGTHSTQSPVTPLFALCRNEVAVAVAIYHGESGYSGCTRDIDHKTDLEKRRKKCDFYYYGETSEFSMSMVSTTTKHFIRKIRDDIEIVAGIRDILRKSCKQNQNFVFRREDPLSVLNWTGGDLHFLF